LARLSLGEVAAQAAQIAAATFGGFVFHLLGIPAAWMSGAMVAVVIWGGFGLTRPMPRPVADAAMLVSGVTMGAGITPEAVAAVGRYPVSLLVLALGVIAVSGASMLWLTRVAGWRRDDALLASVPGALSTVLAIAADRNAAVAAIVVVQSVRLFVIIALLPSVVVMIGGGTATLLPGEGQPVTSAGGLAVALAGGLALGVVFERLRVAAPILLGGTIVSATLHATGSTPGAVPTPLAVAGLVLIGLYIGERFRTVELSSLARVLPAALGSLVISTVVAMVFAALAAKLAGVGFPDAMVAFAPGGIEAMMMLALILGLDPLYVGVHHLARFLGIAVALPFAVTFLTRGER
jgi:membrane AbrB-like protein